MGCCFACRNGCRGCYEAELTTPVFRIGDKVEHCLEPGLFIVTAVPSKISNWRLTVVGFQDGLQLCMFPDNLTLAHGYVHIDRPDAGTDRASY